ncbi:hypothetical protein ABVB69_38895, partial [Streptomyces sp. NPDC000349]|uniref:hypothetical protein n=1 Tax=Streptomyces sp. NPDC000349 TaxID=3154249 RepID=UPI00336A9787
MNDIDDVGVFLGLDVGKSAHHGHGLTPAGKKVFDRQLLSAYSSECTTEYEVVCTTAQATSVSRSMAWRRFL